MKLLASPTSPFARKLRILIIEKKLPVDVQASDSMSPQHPAFALNPLGKLPVLLLDDGSTLIDSPLIAEYLDSLSAPYLIATAQRQAIKQSEAIADGVADAAVLWHMELKRPQAQQSPEFIERQKLKVERGLAYAAQRLQNQGRLIDGLDWSLADIAWLCTFDYCWLRLSDFVADWPSVQTLQVWSRSLQTRLSVVSTQP